ncbi:hypothetical protein ABW20_dc0101604 [Dactylellina cionopaga]|nr:hypothetical protein ABW20_dc0101604 [Dactylellina cionopaga]
MASTATIATSFEMDSIEEVESIPIPRSEGAPESSSTSVDVVESPQSSAECKDALERIKVALEEKASLERRLQELQRLITGKTTQQPPQAPEPQLSHRSIVVESRVPSIISEHVIDNDSEVPTSPTQEVRSGISTRETSFEDDTSMSQESFRMTTVTPRPQQQQQQQRQRPQLPQLQTSLPMPVPPVNDERPTPSTAVRITSAVSRIANWIFGDEEQQQSAYPRSPIHFQSPQAQRPQHASVQTFQLIQAHHLQLTPTSPQHHRRTAHLSAPVASAAPSPARASLPMTGYQQRWRPRNVEDVDPVPPYFEQDPNPSPGFVFFPQNSLLTPLPTPTSPSGFSIAGQMYTQAV